MPIHHMLYRCPRCGHDPLDGHKGKAHCRSCGTSFEQGRGAVIIARPSDGPPEQTDASTLIAAVQELGGPGVHTEQGEDLLSREARIRFGKVEGHDIIRWRGEFLGFSERISWKGEGLLRLEGEALTVTQNERANGSSESFSCLLGEIRGVQISSIALQITLGRNRMYQFEFIEDSPKRWEDLVCLALTRFFARSRHAIEEFKPRIVTTHFDEMPSDEGGGESDAGASDALAPAARTGRGIRTR